MVTLEEKLEGEEKWAWAWEKWPRASEENWAECKSSPRKRGLTLPGVPMKRAQRFPQRKGRWQRLG